MRPHNLYQHGTPELFALAAVNAFGIAKNHPFVDGNKRAAFLTCGLFLELNGQRLEADPDGATGAMSSLAAGDLTEEEFAAWLRVECRPLPPR